MQIPLLVPPGRTGLEPHPVLQYESAPFNGQLGVGWRLDTGSAERNPAFGGVDPCDEGNPNNACYYLSLNAAKYWIVEQEMGRTTSAKRNIL